MAGQREAFIREVVANPADDVPRLIYADWLEDHGDPQGEFIRIQCELARDSNGERRRDLVERERTLLAENREQWTAPLMPGLIRGRFKRGLLEQVEVDAEHFLANHRRWLAWFPILALQVKLSRDQIKSFAAAPAIRQLRSLRVSESDLTQEGWLHLLGSPHLGPLEELWLRSTGIDSLALDWILQRPVAESLKILLLSGNSLGGEGADILIRAPLQRLEYLFISSCNIEPARVAAIKKRLRGVAISA